MTRNEFISMYRTKRKYMKRQKMFTKTWVTAYSFGLLYLAVNLNIISYETYTRLGKNA